MDATYQPQEILDKLQVIFQEEGLQVAIDHCSEKAVFLNITRTAPGMPTAIIVKAVEGTFKRYHPTIKEVVVVNFQNNAPQDSQPAPSSEVSPAFAKLFRNHSQALAFRGLPGLDLQGADNKVTAQALEAFVNLMQDSQRTKFRLLHPNQLAMRVLKQWTAINGAYLHPLVGHDGVWIIHTAQDQELAALSDEAARQVHQEHCLEAEGDVLPASLLAIER